VDPAPRWMAMAAMPRMVAALAARSPRLFLAPSAAPDDPEEEDEGEVMCPLCVEADILQEKPPTARSDFSSTGSQDTRGKRPRRPPSRPQCVKVLGGSVALCALCLASALLPRLKTDRLWPGSRGGLRAGAGGDRQTVLGLELDGGCHNAVVGEECYHHVLWAMQHGIHQKPDWYPGLTPASSMGEFQASLHRAQFGDCPSPCRAPRGLIRPPGSLSPVPPSSRIHYCHGCHRPCYQVLELATRPAQCRH